MAAIDMKPRLDRWWLPTMPLALACAAIAPSYLTTHFLPLAYAIRQGFALVCHQRPERSFWMFGVPVAVCARCLGIYVGAAFGLAMRTSRDRALQFLITAAAINVLDVAAETGGLHGSWMIMRFTLGLGLGAAATLLISSSMPRQELKPDPS
jgi:uncharacterized membrane protein